MAKKAYVGINDIARNISKMYVGVNGVARKVVKGYVGVNGVAQQFWGDGSSAGFWFYYSAVTGNIIEYRGTPLSPSPPPLGTNVVTKLNSGIAFYCISLDSNGACIITFSTDSNAIAYTDVYNGQYVSNPTIGSLTIDNETWYYAYIDMRPNATALNITPNCAIEDSSFTGKTPQQIVTQIINSRIYTDDFAENYQAGQTYNLRAADIEKTIRKAIAIYLYKNATILSSLTAYQTFLANVESVVNYILSDKDNYDKISLQISRDNNAPSVISVKYYYGDASYDNTTLSSSFDSDGYKTFNSTKRFEPKKMGYVNFYNNGNMEHFSMAYTGSIALQIGTWCASISNNKEVDLTNIGLSL